MQKIIIVRKDGRLTVNSGSALADTAARIVRFAADADRHAADRDLATERIVVVHGDLAPEVYEMAKRDVDNLVKMLSDADKEAHEAGADR